MSTSHPQPSRHNLYAAQASHRAQPKGFQGTKGEREGGGGGGRGRGGGAGNAGGGPQTPAREPREEGSKGGRESLLCYTKKAPNAWHRRGTQNTGNTYKQPKRPSTDTTHRPAPNTIERAARESRRITRLQHSSRARLQHSNHPPSSPSHNRVITRSSQPTQPAVKRRRAQPHYTTGTTSLSGDMQLPPSPAWGPHHQEWPMNSPGRTAYF